MILERPKNSKYTKVIKSYIKQSGIGFVSKIIDKFYDEEKIIKNIVQLSNSKRNIINDLFYEGFKYSYLKRMDFFSSQKNGLIGNDEYLGEFKSILNKIDYTEKGILNTEAFLLYALIRRKKPDVVIESGTYKGYSSFFIAEAVKINSRGKFVTISLNQNDCLQSAKDKLKDYNFTEIIEGESQKVLIEKFKEIDGSQRIFIFIDGPKGSMKEFDILLSLLRERIKNGYDINSILIHDCEEHIPIGYDNSLPLGFLNLTRLKTQYYYKKCFSDSYSLKFMDNQYYNRYSFLDEVIFSNSNSDILPHKFKKGRQPSYGTSMALISR